MRQIVLIPKEYAESTWRQVRVARETGLHVIAATGYYTELYYPPHVYQWSTNQLADEMIRELTVGMDSGTVRAGIIVDIGMPLIFTERLTGDANNQPVEFAEGGPFPSSRFGSTYIGRRRLAGPLFVAPVARGTPRLIARRLDSRTTCHLTIGIWTPWRRQTELGQPPALNKMGN